MARSVSPAGRTPQDKPPSATNGTGKRSKPPSTSSASSNPKPALSRSAPHTARAAPVPASASASTREPIGSPVKRTMGASGSSGKDRDARGVSGGAKGVKEILRVQETQGIGRTYMCKMEDGKKVLRSRADLMRLAPDLLDDFHAASASRSRATSAGDDAEASDDSSEVVVSSKRRPKKAATAKSPKGKGKARAVQDDEDDDIEMRDASNGQDEDEDEDEDEGDASSDEADNSADEDVSEPSSESSASSAGEDGATDESDADELGFRRSKRAAAAEKKKRATRQQQKKTRDQGKRRSARGATRQGKRYDFGDGRVTLGSEEDEQDSDDEDEDEDDSSARSRASPRAQRASARLTRASATQSKSRSRSGTGTASPEDGEDKGESSDELSIQSKRRGRAAVADSEEDDDGYVDELPSESSSGANVEEERPQDHHRETCGKCGNAPASILLNRIKVRRAKTKKQPGRRRRRDDFDEDTDAEEERVDKYGAWIECGVCCQSYHFGCLPQPQKRELTDKLKAEHLARHAPPPAATAAVVENNGALLVPGSAAPTPTGSKSTTPMPANVPARPKDELDTKRTFTLAKCPMCKKAGGRKCFGCGLSGRRITQREKEELGPRLAKGKKKAEAGEPDKAAAADEKVDGEKAVDEALKPGLMFRCSKCKRIAHYGCLENDEPEWTFEQHTRSYLEWQICHDCYTYSEPLDVILAWAEADPLPSGDGDDVDPDDEPVEHAAGGTRVDDKTQKVVVLPSAKDLRANAKYLVKFKGESYRQLEWVPHAFLAASYQSKLSNFLARGSLVKFETAKDDDPEDADPTDTGDKDDGEAPLPDPNALERVPEAWRTVDRVLDVWYTHPKTGEDTAFASFQKYLPDDPDESIKLVSQCYLKWGDLAYAEATVEQPPQPDEDGYDAYVAAYRAFLDACSPQMRVPALNKKQMDELDRPRDPKRFVKLTEQPDYIKGHKLHDFQIEGINFLRNRWWLRKGCILADEMGLGKTCQVITFLTHLNKKEGARPFLVIVPNSLIGNWMREFAQWAPSMRVVPYNGDGESRKIVEDYELFDARGALKTHVVLATYEAVAGNARVFRKVDRWDCLVVDEGQRLKAGPDSQLYGAIASLRVAQRVLLTGTPLNNNIKELFNLLAFINPDEYDDIDKLVQEYAELTPERVEKIRGMLKPYFLRRTKETSLNLPPLIEVVVPVSMTVLQRGLYRSILERNAAAIRSIVQSSSSRAKPTKGKKTGSFVNILMELRKSLCHPYLVDADMEPLVATAQEALRNLTDASAKFVLLARMLPKLKAAGHRVLIFSQFKLTLNVIERFLAGLELKYLRLDGDTPQIERQRGVDKYNAPGSEYFAYLLSTRAGGVGLNITSADVVIIYDQDFNPQMDLQAISRAHRMGQTKPVRVFKLVVKGTCEEKILNAGSKKRGLEHLIIQRIDAKDETEDMESMLQFGAQAVFDDQAAEASAIRYTDADIDDLLAKTADPAAKESDSAATFAQAQIWTRDKGDGEGAGPSVAVDGDATGDDGEGDKQDLHDFWSKVVEQQQEVEKANKAAQAATVGRGKRKRAEVNYQLVAPRAKNKAKDVGSPHSTVDDLSSGDDYRHQEDNDSDDDFLGQLDADDKRLDSDFTSVQKPPALARVKQTGATSADGAPPPHKKQKKHATPDEKARNRLLKLVALSQEAFQAGCPQAQAHFNAAVKARSRTKQTELVRSGIKLLEEQAQRLKQEALVNKAAVTGAARVLGPFTAPHPQPAPAAKPVASNVGASGSGHQAKPAPTQQSAAVRPASVKASSPAETRAPSLHPAPTSAGMVRVDSAVASDTSGKSASGTPKLKQMQLSFGKPANANASPAPTVPAKRPSPPHASAPAPPKRPSPAVAAAAAPLKKKSTETLVISDSE